MTRLYQPGQLVMLSEFAEGELSSPLLASPQLSLPTPQRCPRTPCACWSPRTRTRTTMATEMSSRTR